MANDPNLYGPKQDASKTALVEREKAGEVQKAPKNKRVARYWREIERYKRAVNDWYEEVKAIENLYLEQDRAMNSSNRRFALLWANVETMKPAVYAKLPNVECTRRFKDRDPVARTAAELMERASNTTLELYGVDETFQMVRDDRLLGGRGQAWVRYEATVEQYDLDEGDDAGESDSAAPAALSETKTETDAGEDATSDGDEERKIGERLEGEKVCVDYVHLMDFGHNVAQTWNDVWLCWRWVYKTREEVEERFGKKMADRVTYNAKAPATLQDRADSTSTGSETSDEFCKIAEVWDKRARMVTWLSEGMGDDVMDEGEPPVNFSGFFPCPRPCYATKTSRSLIPRPDYMYYRDQAKEINDLTDKIGNMMTWLIVKAFMPASPSRVVDPIEEAVRDNSNRELIVQVEDWNQFTEKGGAKGLIDWLPLDMIIQAIGAAINARNQLIQDVFQITGLSDILRGQSDPNETLGAQELKAQTGTRRLRNTKDEVARFCADTGRLVAEVIAEKFEPESIAEITGFRYQPTQPPRPGVEAIGANGGPRMDMFSAAGDWQRPALPLPAVVQNVQGMGGPLAGMGGGAPITLPQPGVPAMGAPGGLPGMPPMLPPPPPPLPPAPTGADGWADGGDAVFGDDVMKLLRNDRLRSFRIDIETDSTAQPNEAQEQQRRTQFLEATGAFLDRAVASLQTAPELAPVAGEMLTFAVRSFRAGRGLEETIERTFANIAKKAEQAANQPAPENPDVIKAKADADAQRQKMAQEQIEHQQSMEATRLKTEADLSLKAAQQRLLEQQQVNEQREHEFRMAELQRKADAERAEAVNRAMVAASSPPAEGIPNGAQ